MITLLKARIAYYLLRGFKLYNIDGECLFDIYDGDNKTEKKMFYLFKDQTRISIEQ